MALQMRRWPAVMAPRDAGLRADDPVASRAELQMAVELRSRAPGPVLPAPAGERWPFCARPDAFFLRGSSISLTFSCCTTIADLRTTLARAS